MAKPLTDSINALTQYANTVTGASDQTLSEAVATLASGYGGGGTSESGTLTLDSATKTLTFNLGFVPSHFAIIADETTVPTDNSWKTTGFYIAEIGGIAYVTQAYGPGNRSGSQREASYITLTGTTLQFTANYNFALADYEWIAW